ncbi:MFS transporter [Microbacterium elymi]|uniref:MFS transporter n=1 Tax=Microbacterium elymi TaxID=2909587 RepID=A0ABY5NLY4_9MICO|nr:MFS transporter [Microbacterium elymi]UUT36193.1 MFS transporter [Microbacterium elymi]
MPERTARIRSLALLTVVIVLSATMLRGPILAVAPVALDIGDDLGVGAGVVGLLTTIPVLCFAVCAPLAIAIIRRAGADVALTVTVIGVILGSILRSSGGIGTALAGTAVMGAFVTIGNVVLPIVIAREYSARRAHTMTGVYTSALNVGTLAVTLGTAPMADAVGWRWAIVAWSMFGVAALATWIPLARSARRVRAAPRPAPGHRRSARVGAAPRAHLDPGLRRSRGRRSPSTRSPPGCRRSWPVRATRTPTRASSPRSSRSPGSPDASSCR